MNMIALGLIALGIFISGLVIGYDYGKEFDSDTYVSCLEDGGTKIFCSNYTVSPNNKESDE